MRKKEVMLITEKPNYIGLCMEAINADGSDLTMIPFEFIHREA